MTARQRWIVLLGILALTVGAALYPTQQEAPVAAVHVARPATPPKPLPAANPVASKQTVAVIASADATLPELQDDPFATVDWNKPPPPPPPPKVVPIVSAPPPAPVEPAMPYKFMGRMEDQDGNTVVYLARGQDSIVAHEGDQLDADYKLVSVTEHKLSIAYLPMNHTHDIPLDTP